MNQQIVQLSLLVKEYDEAIAFYTQKLGFELLENTQLSDSKRWVVVRPKNSLGCGILLAKAASKKQQSAVGNQAGGRVLLFLHTDDFNRDYDRMMANGVSFTEMPRTETYGKVVVFKDLYGNLWDLMEST